MIFAKRKQLALRRETKFSFCDVRKCQFAKTSLKKNKKIIQSTINVSVKQKKKNNDDCINIIIMDCFKSEIKFRKRGVHT